MRRCRGVPSLWLCAPTLLGCEHPSPEPLSVCQVYRPHFAKQTFDGRVGAVLLHNASQREVEMKVYHPDGVGDVELQRRVAAGGHQPLGSSHLRAGLPSNESRGQAVAPDRTPHDPP